MGLGPGMRGSDMALCMKWDLPTPLAPMTEILMLSMAIIAYSQLMIVEHSHIILVTLYVEPAGALLKSFHDYDYMSWPYFAYDVYRGI